MKGKLIIAHRGDASRAVENTVSAFEKAIELGADMIEFDVRRTKDKILVVFHNRGNLRQLVKEMSWQSLQRMNKRKNLEIPKLEDVLRSIKGKVQFDIELKEIGYEKEAIELILKYLDKNEFIITSFHDSSISRIKENYPDVKTGLLLGVQKPREILRSKLSILKLGKRLEISRADFFLPHALLVKLGFLKKAKDFGKPCIVWGVNRKKMMEKMLRDERVLGIITDRLEMALALKSEIGNKL